MLGWEEGSQWLGGRGERTRTRRTHVMLGDPRRPEEQVCVRALVADECGRRDFGCSRIRDLDLLPPALEEVATVGGILLVLLVTRASRLLGRSHVDSSCGLKGRPDKKSCKRKVAQDGARPAQQPDNTIFERVTQAIETFKMISFSHLLRPRKLRSFFSLFANPEFRRGCVDVTTTSYGSQLEVIFFICHDALLILLIAQKLDEP
eukprot:759364-Hanusia_phi.AAC.5